MANKQINGRTGKMKKTTSILMFVILMLSFCQQGWSYNDNHGPFEKGKGPNSFEIYKLDHLKPQNPNSGITIFGQKGSKRKHKVHLTVHSAVLQVTSVTIFNSKEDLVFGPEPVSRHCIAPNVYWADLNRDNKDDFIIRMRTGGVGLAGSYCDITFILSNESGYKSTTINTLSPSQLNFVDFRSDGNCQLIHTSLERVDKCKDGKTHNFWVYNILAFEGDKVKVDNSLHPEFPKTIWFTFKPNHTETTIITNEQKERIRKESLRPGVKTEVKAETPDVGVGGTSGEDGVDKKVSAPFISSPDLQIPNVDLPVRLIASDNDGQVERYHWRLNLTKPVCLVRHFLIIEGDTIRGPWGGRHLKPISPKNGTNVDYQLIKSNDGDNLDFLIREKQSDEGSISYHDDAVSNSSDYDYNVYQPDCDHIRTYILKEPVGLDEKYKPLWKHDFIKDGSVIKTLMYAIRVRGENEDNSFVPSIKNIKDNTNDMLKIKDAAVASRHTLRYILNKNNIEAEGLDASLIDEDITGYWVLNDPEVFCIAYYLNTRPGPLSKIYVKSLDKKQNKWTQNEIYFKTIKAVRYFSPGQIQKIIYTPDHVYLSIHTNPSAAYTLVLTKDLKFQTVLYGWPEKIFDDGTLVYHNSQVHFAPTHSAEISIYNPHTKVDKKIYPAKPYSKIRTDHIRKVKAAYEKIGDDWFRNNNHHMDPERFNNHLRSEVTIDNEKRSLSFVIGYDNKNFGAEGVTKVFHVYENIDADEIKVSETLVSSGTIKASEALNSRSEKTNVQVEAGKVKS